MPFELGLEGYMGNHQAPGGEKLGAQGAAKAKEWGWGAPDLEEMILLFKYEFCRRE